MKIKFVIPIVAIFVLICVALAQDEAPRFKVSFFEKQEGDKLIYRAHFCSLWSDEATTHENFLEWRSQVEKFTDIIVDLPENVSS